MNIKNKSIKITPKPIEIITSTVDPIVWLSYSFAPDWFNDAYNEAVNGKDHNSKRREIIFAVCTAESYIVEWVRDYILNKNYLLLSNYFKTDQRIGTEQKWKNILNQLFREKKISKIPDCSNNEWCNFTRLIKLRNGLIHASSSKPESLSITEKENPYPSRSELDKIKHGWATRTIAIWIKHVHNEINTQAPDWLKYP
jgi:hypothetical protein